MTFYIYAPCGVLLFTLGLRGLIVLPHLVRRILAFNVMGSGAFLFLVSLADRDASAPDPVPQALVLTGIVVSVSITALALALIRRLDLLGEGTHLPEELPAGEKAVKA
jgi:multicomponent Na+:H+ antiporter subunit C